MVFVSILASFWAGSTAIVLSDTVSSPSLLVEINNTAAAGASNLPATTRQLRKEKFIMHHDNIRGGTNEERDTANDVHQRNNNKICQLLQCTEQSPLSGAGVISFSVEFGCMEISSNPDDETVVLISCGS